jgi:ribosomal protein L24
VAYLHKGRATRIGYRIEPDGKKVRIARTTGDVIE